MQKWYKILILEWIALFLSLPLTWWIHNTIGLIAATWTWTVALLIYGVFVILGFTKGN